MSSRVLRCTASTSSSSSSSSSRMVEVERKYQLAPHTLSSLRFAIEKLGGRRKGDSALTFHDVYWDREETQVLTRNDTWLRERGKGKGDLSSSWELKIPPRNKRGGGKRGDNRSGGERGIFLEHHGVERVAETLAKHGYLSHDPYISSFSPPPFFESFLRAEGYAPFASFWTSRECFSLPNGVQVDADEVSFDHAVVEVEELVAKEEEVEEAERRIRETARELCLVPLEEGKGGKMETYLRKFSPKHLQALKEEGILIG